MGILSRVFLHLPNSELRLYYKWGSFRSKVNDKWRFQFNAVNIFFESLVGRSYYILLILDRVLRVFVSTVTFLNRPV